VISLKSKRIFFVFIAIFLFIITGCSSKIDNDAQVLEVQKRVGDENGFEDFRRITDNKKVQKVKEILHKTDWENAQVSMSRPPDYQFIFKYKDPNTEAKPIVHTVWISPNKDKLEVVRGDDQYTQFSKEQSAIIFEIITGDNLSEQK
jgi:hypothetical protein